jgi:putative MATE family efflux protein
MSPQQQPNITEAILQEDIIKLMLRLAPPGIVAMLLISLNNFIDVFFAGQFIGETALAAISLALPIAFIVTASAISIGVGSASVLSQAIGSGDVKTQSKIFSNLTILSIIASIVISVLGYAFCEKLISFMGGEGQVTAYGTDYLKIYMLGSIFFLLSISSSQLIKAEGKIELATKFTAIFVTTNIILNYTFIKFFNWGIKGIALATVLSGLVYATVNFTYFLSGKSSIPVNLKRFTLAIDLLPATLSVGASVMLMDSLEVVQQAVIFKSIAHYGRVTDIAFMGATLNLFSLTITPIYGFVQALQPVIGMNYGARYYERLKKAYFTFGIGGTILSILIWLPLQIFPETFLGWLLPSVSFTNNDLLNFRIVLVILPVVSFVWCSIALFQAMGNGKIAGIIILNRQLFLFIPIVLIVPRFLGVNGVYYSLAIVDVFNTLLVVYFTLMEFKKLRIQFKTQ